MNAGCKPKKGDVILVVKMWSDGGTAEQPSRPAVSVRRLTVQSWGKVQGTATDDAGAFIKQQLYPGLQFAFEGEDIAPLVAAEKAVIRSRIEGKIRTTETWLAGYPHARPEFRARALDRLAYCESILGDEVEVATYATLRDAIR